MSSPCKLTRFWQLIMITSLLLLTIYYNEEKNKISDVEYQNVKICRLGDYRIPARYLLMEWDRQVKSYTYIFILVCCKNITNRDKSNNWKRNKDHHKMLMFGANYVRNPVWGIYRIFRFLKTLLSISICKHFMIIWN